MTTKKLTIIGTKSKLPSPRPPKLKRPGANKQASTRPAGYDCPNKTVADTSLKGILTLLDSNQGFADFFTKKLLEAILGNRDAIDCVDSYLLPDWDEMEALAVPPDDQPSMRHCTDTAGLLIIAKYHKP